MHMLQFDIHTRNDWNHRNIQHVSLEFIKAGCDGTEIRIYENMIRDAYTPVSIDDTSIVCYIHPSDQSLLQGAFITGVKGKWILKSDQILTRCGCSKSFSLKTGDNFADKVRLLKSKLSKKTKHSL